MVEMSGVCMRKKGRTVRCGECNGKARSIEDDYCSHCGEYVVMRWNLDKDCLYGEEEDHE
jgi:predicted amidophosphoribosyltransferase